MGPPPFLRGVPRAAPPRRAEGSEPELGAAPAPSGKPPVTGPAAAPGPAASPSPPAVLEKGLKGGENKKIKFKMNGKRGKTECCRGVRAREVFAPRDAGMLPRNRGGPGEGAQGLCSSGTP